MTSSAIAASSPGAPVGRYQGAEAALWGHYGLEPKERFIDLDSPAIRLRALEVGSGEPVLFVHGTVGPGRWASLIRELPDFRCLVLERPGWGLSEAVDFSKYEYKTVVADLLRGVLDVLGVDRAHVVEGRSGTSGPFVWPHGIRLESAGSS
jgi:hypothetical protein